VQYHQVVDVIKVFIRTVRLTDYNGHISCIVTKMLNINAKGVQLYCQHMQEFKTLPTYKETLDSVTAPGNHAVR